MPTKTVCTACQESVLIRDEHVGRLVRCPSCKATFTAQAESPAEPSVSRPPARKSARSTEADDFSPENFGGFTTTPSSRSPHSPNDESSAPPARSTRSAPRFRFPVVVLSDSLEEIEGRLEAEVSADGLRLYRGSQSVALAAVGSQVTHLGSGELEIVLQRRTLQLHVKQGKHSEALAEDLAEYLRGDGPPLRPHKYGAGNKSNSTQTALIAIPVAIVVGLLSYFGVSWLNKPPSIPDSQWQDFNPPGLACQMRLPGAPRLQVQPGAMGLEGQIRMWMVEVKRPDSAFGFGHARLAPFLPLLGNEMEQFFEGARRGMLTNPGAEVAEVSQADITLNRHPGKQFVLDVKNKGRSQGKMTVRIYLVNRDIYMILAGGTNFEADTPDVVKFFDSFKLTGPEVPVLGQGPAPLPPPDFPGAGEPGPGPGFEQPQPPQAMKDGRIRYRLPGPNEIRVMRYTPDGQSLLAYHADGGLRVWNLSTGQSQQLMQRVQGPEMPTIALTPDKQQMLVAQGGKVWRWNVGTQQLSERANIRGTSFAATNNLLAIAEPEKFHLLDLAKGTPQPLFASSSLIKESLAFSPNGKWFAASTREGLVCLWEVESRKLLWSSAAHSRPPQHLVFTPDSMTLLSAGRDEDRTVYAWDSSNGVQRYCVTAVVQHQELAVDPTGKFLAIRGTDQVVRLWNLTTGGACGELQTGGALSLAFSPDGQTLAVGQNQGAMFYIVESIVTAAGPPAGPSTNVQQTLPGRLQATLAERKTALLTMPRGAGRITALAYSPDGKTLAAGCQQGNIRLWDLPSGNVLATFRAHRELRALAFSPNSQLFATAEGDGLIRVREARTGQVRGGLDYLFHERTEQLAFGPKSDSLVVRANGRAYGIRWDPSEQRLGATHTAPDGTFALVNADGSVGSCGAVEIGQGTIRWQSPTTPKGQDTVVNLGGPNQYSLPSGKKAAVAFGSRIWVMETLTGKPITTLTGTVSIPAVTLSPDGNLVAAGKDDGQISLWDIASQSLLLTLPEESRLMGISTLAFSPDSKTLAVGTAEGVHVWDAAFVLSRANQTAEKSRPKHMLTLENSRADRVEFSGGDRLAVLNQRPGSSSKLSFFDLSRSPASELMKLEIDMGPRPLIAISERLLVTYSAGRQLELHSLPRAVGVAPRKLPADGLLTGLALTPDGKTLAVAQRDGIVLWETTAGRQLKTIPMRDRVTALEFCGDGKTLVGVIGLSEGTLRTWNWQTGKQLLEMPAPRSGLNPTLSVSQDGQRAVLFSSTARTPLLFDLPLKKETAIQLPSTPGSFRGPRTAAITPSGKHILLGTDEGQLTIWDVATSKPLFSFQALTQEVASIRVSPDGKQVAVGGRSGLQGKGEVRVWDAQQWFAAP